MEYIVPVVTVGILLLIPYTISKSVYFVREKQQIIIERFGKFRYVKMGISSHSSPLFSPLSLRIQQDCIGARS